MFSDDAIYCAAICEQLEDISYCINHKMNHLNGGKEEEKWNAEARKADAYGEKDNQKTFNSANIARFKKEVDKFLLKHPKVQKYDGLTENEKFACRHFYYYNTY